MACMGDVVDIPHLYAAHSFFDIDKLHALVPVECYEWKVPGDGAGVNIKRKQKGPV